MDSPLDRLEDLLVARSLAGLNADETRELEQLLAANPQIDADAFDRAAAAVSIGHLRVTEAMPRVLYEQIEAAGMSIVAEKQRTATAPPRATVTRRTLPRESALTRSRARARRYSTLPWAVAAACLIAAVTAWWPGARDSGGASLEAMRAELIEQGARVVSWDVTEDPSAAGAFGDVVWDAASQTGFLRIGMLEVNDPTEFQYQLWIFDAERDERYPVDGGVFDIVAGSQETVVRIRPAIPVHSAALFAVTVEMPGGVVVSSRERITLIADFSSA